MANAMHTCDVATMATRLLSNVAFILFPSLCKVQPCYVNSPSPVGAAGGGVGAGAGLGAG